jgi:hypothetical protein
VGLMALSQASARTLVEGVALLLSGATYVNQSPRPKGRHNFFEARVGNRKAALAAAENTQVADYRFTHVPSSVHDDRPAGRIGIRGIESIQAYRASMSADIPLASSISSRGRSVRMSLIRKALQPTGMRRIRAANMRDPARPGGSGSFRRGG